MCNEWLTDYCIHGNAVPTVKITLGTPFPGVPAGNYPWILMLYCTVESSSIDTALHVCTQTSKQKDRCRQIYWASVNTARVPSFSVITSNTWQQWVNLAYIITTKHCRQTDILDTDHSHTLRKRLSAERADNSTAVMLQVSELMVRRRASLTWHVVPVSNVCYHHQTNAKHNTTSEWATTKARTIVRTWRCDWTGRHTRSTRLRSWWQGWHWAWWWRRYIRHRWNWWGICHSVMCRLSRGWCQHCHYTHTHTHTHSSVSVSN